MPPTPTAATALTTPTTPATPGVNSQTANIIAQYKQANPSAVTQQSGASSWYSQIKQPTKTTTATPEEGSTFSSVGGDIGQDVNTRADTVGQIENSADTLPSKVLQIGGQGAGAVQDAAGEVIKSAIKPEVLQAIGTHLAPLVQSASQSPAGKTILDWFGKLSPETQRNLGATGDIASLLSNAVGAGAAKEGAVAGTEAALGAAKDVATPLAESAQSAVDATKAGVKNVAGAATQKVKDTVQSAAANGKIPGMEGLGEQTKTSASRMAEQMPLIGAGAAREAKPIDAYNTFAAQEAKHLADIKEDPAISKVGSEIGDAFTSVVKQRQAAGKTMSAELEKTGASAVDTKDALGNFQKELADNGTSFNPKTREVSAGSESKFSSADQNVLEKYATGLQDLGKNPSMKSLDAFISRIPNEIKALKAKTGITFKTNAERLISNNLNDLRTALGKSGTPAYNTARKTYADLSKFINEGASHLGKITQSGDFAKDASLAKSSVQSVLNNGKKDWLIKLEDLTGYPALDRSTLALQAMKDAGDFKGNSLLELLTEGAEGAVAGPHGTIANLIGKSGKMLGKTVAGSKADQTRAFLKSLEKGAKTGGQSAAVSEAESSGKSSMLDKAKDAFNTIKKEGNKGFIKIPGVKEVPDPAKIAKTLSPNDFKTIQEYLNVKSEGQNAFVSPVHDMALTAVMEKLGLEKVSGIGKSIFPTEQAKTSYLSELIDHYNAQNTKDSLITSNKKPKIYSTTKAKDIKKVTK